MPVHGQRYNIVLFYNIDLFPAIFLNSYTDLFDNNYINLFMDDSGRMFEIANVQKWE